MYTRVGFELVMVSDQPCLSLSRIWYKQNWNTFAGRLEQDETYIRRLEEVEAYWSMLKHVHFQHAKNEKALSGFEPLRAG